MSNSMRTARRQVTKANKMPDEFVFFLEVLPVDVEVDYLLEEFNLDTPGKFREMIEWLTGEDMARLENKLRDIEAGRNVEDAARYIKADGLMNVIYGLDVVFDYEEGDTDVPEDWDEQFQDALNALDRAIDAAEAWYAAELEELGIMNRKRDDRSESRKADARNRKALRMGKYEHDDDEYDENGYTREGAAQALGISADASVDSAISRMDDLFMYVEDVPTSAYEVSDAGDEGYWDEYSEEYITEDSWSYSLDDKQTIAMLDYFGFGHVINDLTSGDIWDAYKYDERTIVDMHSELEREIKEIFDPEHRVYDGPLYVGRRAEKSRKRVQKADEDYYGLFYEVGYSDLMQDDIEYAGGVEELASEMTDNVVRAMWNTVDVLEYAFEAAARGDFDEAWAAVSEGNPDAPTAWDFLDEAGVTVDWDFEYEETTSDPRKVISALESTIPELEDKLYQYALDWATEVNSDVSARKQSSERSEKSSQSRVEKEEHYERANLVQLFLNASQGRRRVEDVDDALEALDEITLGIQDALDMFWEQEDDGIEIGDMQTYPIDREEVSVIAALSNKEDAMSFVSNDPYDWYDWSEPAWQSFENRMYDKVKEIFDPNQEVYYRRAEKSRKRITKAGPGKDKLAELLGLADSDATYEEAMDAADELLAPVTEAVGDYWAEYESMSDEERDADELTMDWDVDLYDDSIKLVRAYDPGLAQALDKVDPELMYAYTESDADMVREAVEFAIDDYFDKEDD